jgi:hypothetical protein
MRHDTARCILWEGMRDGANRILVKVKVGLRQAKPQVPDSQPFPTPRICKPRAKACRKVSEDVTDGELKLGDKGEKQGCGCDKGLDQQPNCVLLRRSLSITQHTLCTLEEFLLTGILPRSAGTHSRMSSSPLASCRRGRKGSFLHREQPSAIALMPARCGKPCVGSEQLHLPPPTHLLPGWQTNNHERVASATARIRERRCPGGGGVWRRGWHTPTN